MKYSWACNVCILSRSVVSNSEIPMDCSTSGSPAYGGSTGRNTGVGCHALKASQFSLGANHRPKKPSPVSLSFFLGIGGRNLHFLQINVRAPCPLQDGFLALSAKKRRHPAMTYVISKLSLNSYNALYLVLGSKVPTPRLPSIYSEWYKCQIINGHPVSQRRAGTCPRSCSRYVSELKLQSMSTSSSCV